MSDPSAAPIVVNAKAGPDQWAAAIRQSILVLAGIASAFGYSHLASELGLVCAVAGPAGGVVVFVLGQLKTRRMANQAATLAKAAPDSVATVKP